MFVFFSHRNAWPIILSWPVLLWMRVLRRKMAISDAGMGSWLQWLGDYWSSTPPRMILDSCVKLACKSVARWLSCHFSSLISKPLSQFSMLRFVKRVCNIWKQGWAWGRGYHISLLCSIELLLLHSSRLSVMIKYHKLYAVEMSTICDLLKDIKRHTSLSTISPPIPQDYWVRCITTSTHALI